MNHFAQIDLELSIEDTVRNQLKTAYGEALREVNVSDICTGDYYTVVELTDGMQGAAINLLNVHGPHRRPHDYISYDNRLLHLSESDPLLQEMSFACRPLEPAAQSVSVAILNALSSRFYSDTFLRENGLARSDGFLKLRPFIRPGDVITMIGCLGNYSCCDVGKMADVKKVFFSDFEYIDHYKAGVDEFVRDVFHAPEIVAISDGSRNREICESADVVIITADTLCTNTLDGLLEWSKGAREVLVVGWSYAMDPTVLFARGVSGMTTKCAIRGNIPMWLRQKIEREGKGYTQAFKGCFERVNIVKKVK